MSLQLMYKIEFDEHLRSIVKDMPSQYAQQSEMLIKGLLSRSDDLPQEIPWVYKSEDALLHKLLAAASSEERSRILWQATANLATTYGISVVWRASELVIGALAALRSNLLVSAGALSRAALELGVSFAMTSAKYGGCVKARLDSAAAQPNDIELKLANIRSGDNEQLRTILTATGFDVVVSLWLMLDQNYFGTRIDELKHLPKQKNVLSHLQAATKAMGKDDLDLIYSYLCEMTHPNHVGFARFIDGIGEQNVRQSLKRNASSKVNDGMTGIMLCALGWSSFVILDGWKQISESAQKIGQRWPNQMHRL